MKYAFPRVADLSAAAASFDAVAETYRVQAIALFEVSGWINSGNWQGDSGSKAQLVVAKYGEVLSSSSDTHRDAATALRSMVSELNGLKYAYDAAWNKYMAAMRGDGVVDFVKTQLAEHGVQTQEARLKGALNRAAGKFDVLSGRAERAKAQAQANETWRLITGAVGQTLKSLTLGVVDAVVDIAKAAAALLVLSAKLSLMRQMIDPKGYFRDAKQFYGGLAHMVTHPGETLKSVTELDLLAKDPARWVGKVAGNIVIMIATDGIGTAFKGGKAAAVVETTIAKTTIETVGQQTLKSASIATEKTLAREATQQLGGVAIKDGVQIVEKKTMKELQQNALKKIEESTAKASKKGYEYSATGTRSDLEQSLLKGRVKPQVADSELKSLIDNQVWKDTGKIGNGSTADAIRAELRSGNPVGGVTSHMEKGANTVQSLREWIRKNPTASVADRSAAQQEADDIWLALNGK
jgi:hypothetical protein